MKERIDNILEEMRACYSCHASMINNRITHEKNCPEAWKDTERKCRWCEKEFKPVYNGNYFCCLWCAEEAISCAGRSFHIIKSF